MAEAAGSDEPLVATNHGRVLPAHEHRLDEAELPQGAGQGIELDVADTPRVGRIGMEVIDDDIDDDERREGDGRGHGMGLLLVGRCGVVSGAITSAPAGAGRDVRWSGSGRSPAGVHPAGVR